MNYKLIILSLLFITSGIFYYQLTGSSFKTDTILITRIIDGDTLETASGQRIRLLGINTPESSMPFYEEAKNLLKLMRKY